MKLTSATWKVPKIVSNVARNKFNEAARIYNEKVRQFPTKLAAMIFGFKAKPYFKSAAGAENAPTVNFN